MYSEPGKQLLLNESFYNQRTKEGEFSSLKFVQKYMSKHGIDTLLADSFHKQVAGRQLPRNPYAGMYRQLSQSIFRRNLEQFFEEVHDRKMLTNSIGESMSPINAELLLNSNLTVFAAAALLTYVNRKCCEDLIKQFQGTSIQEDRRVKQVLISFGGTELLRSQVLPYVDSSESPIELFYYIFIEDKGETAAGIFAQIVYNEALNCIRSAGSTLHFQQLIIEQLQTNNFSVDYTWSRADILLYKAKLIKEITKALDVNGEVVLRCLELYQNSFVKVSRRYTLVVVEKGVATSMQIYPLSSVHRGVFTDREDLLLYLKICSETDTEETASQSDLIDLFILGQSTRILKYLFIQDLRKAAWEIFYLCISSPAELFEQILDQTILNILTGDMSEVESIRLQLEICEERLKAQLFKDRVEVESVLDQILSRLKGVIEKGRNSDLLRFREMLAKLSLYCLDCMKQNGWKQRIRSLLRQLASTLKFIVCNSDQLEVGLNQKQFNELVQQMREMSTIDTASRSIVHYEQLIKDKHPPDVVNVPDQAVRLRSELGLRSQAQAADLVHILYFKQFSLFENIYHFYLGIFFGSKGGYPLAQLLTAIGEFTFENQYFGEQSRSLDEMLTHQPIQESEISKDLLIDSIRFEGREIVGYHGCLRYAHVQEVRRLQQLFELVQLNRAQLKIPGNCDLTELFSVSGEHLLSSSHFTERSIATLYLNIDVVVRGGTQKQSDSLFYELVMQKCRIVESQPNMGAIGFYNHKDRQQSYRLYDPKLVLTAEEFKQFTESNNELYLKTVLFVEDRIKIVNYRLNLHNVRADNDTASHLHTTSDFHQRHRLFFSSKDILLWSRVLPPKPSTTNDYYFYEDLDMNAATKQYLISSLEKMTEQTRKGVQTIFQVLHFCSEKIHFLAREILNFYYLLQYVKKDRRGKFEIRQTQASLEMSTSKIIQLLEQHAYCYNQGLSVAVVQHCRILNDYVQLHQQSNGEEKELLYLERRTYLLFEMLEHNSQTLHIEYRNILKRTNPSLSLIV